MMSKKRGRQARTIALATAHDPELCRYPTLTDALRACLPLLAEAILTDAANHVAESETTDRTPTKGADRPAATLGE
jgi:hypothetical protein